MTRFNPATWYRRPTVATLNIEFFDAVKSSSKISSKMNVESVWGRENFFVSVFSTFLKRGPAYQSSHPDSPINLSIINSIILFTDSVARKETSGIDSKPLVPLPATTAENGQLSESPHLQSHSLVNVMWLQPWLEILRLCHWPVHHWRISASRNQFSIKSVIFRTELLTTWPSSLTKKRKASPNPWQQKSWPVAVKTLIHCSMQQMTEKRIEHWADQANNEQHSWAAFSASDWCGASQVTPSLAITSHRQHQHLVSLRFH